ncbi:MAG TPA: endolytic transglycosylase MltG, partial [Chitinophagaceae bacterium]
MKKRKIILGLLVIIILFGAFVASKFFGAAVSTPSGEFFYVKTGATYDDVKKELVEKKYLANSYWFDWTSKVLKYNTVKPGRYKLKKGMNLVNLVRMLRSGDQAVVNFVITKIRTKEILASRAGRSFECDSSAIIHFLNNADSLRPFGFDTTTVMAAAMPLTYAINWNTTPGKIFRQFNTAYQQFWNTERKTKAAALGLTPI